MQRARNINYIIPLEKGWMFMAIVQICDFGEFNGVQTYRINGDKRDLEKIIAECRKEDEYCFDGQPNLHLVRKDCWTLLIRVKVAVKVGERVDRDT